MSIKHWLGCACAVWLISLAAQGCGSRAARPTQALGMAGAAAGVGAFSLFGVEL